MNTAPNIGPVKQHAGSLVTLVSLVVLLLALILGWAYGGESNNEPTHPGVRQLVLVLCWIGLAGVFAGLGRAAGNGFSAILVSAHNRYSLSRSQMIAWSLVVLGGLLAIGCVNLAADASRALDITIDGTLLAAMGISAFSAVATPTILSVKAAQAPDRAVVATNDRFDDAWLGDLVRSDDADSADSVDVTKVQQLAITLIVLVVYIAMLLQRFRIGTAYVAGLPAPSEQFVALLAISHAGYLVFKAVPKPSANDSTHVDTASNSAATPPAIPPPPQPVPHPRIGQIG